MARRGSTPAEREEAHGRCRRDHPQSCGGPMESANRVLTRRALEVLKSIAIGEYRAEMAKADMISEGGPAESPDSQETESETESAPADEAEVTSEENSAEAQENPAETESKSE